MNTNHVAYLTVKFIRKESIVLKSLYQILLVAHLHQINADSLSARILHHAPPPPAPSGPKFSNSENCCGSENAMPPKIFWDMEGHRGHFRSKNVFFFKKHTLEKIHNKSHYFFKF